MRNIVFLKIIPAYLPEEFSMEGYWTEPVSDTQLGFIQGAAKK